MNKMFPLGPPPGGALSVTLNPVTAARPGGSLGGAPPLAPSIKWWLMINIFPLMPPPEGARSVTVTAALQVEVWEEEPHLWLEQVQTARLRGALSH